MNDRVTHRSGGRQARRAKRARPGPAVVGPGLAGGGYKPLTDRDVERIHQTALDLLERVGMANPLPILKEHALAKGCWLDDYGRLCFPRTLVEDVIAAMPRSFVTHGRDPKYDQEHAAGSVHFGPGGDSVSILEVDGRRYRPSTVIDLYDFARLTDRLEHVHNFSQVVVATEIADLHAADVNMAYAAMAGTTKHVSLSPNNARHLDSLIHLMDLVLGGEGKHRERPFCSAGGCCVVSPLAYGDDNSEVCLAATRLGSPVWPPQASEPPYPGNNPVTARSESFLLHSFQEPS